MSESAHTYTSEEIAVLEEKYSAHNYHPLPVCFAKAEGAKVWDPEGREYLDFLSAYSAVNQGHCHPKIIKALCDQAQKLTLSSRAFYNNVFGPFAKFITEYFGYEMVLPMNTGAEAVETACKLARLWGYRAKGIPQGDAMILSCANNFHGRTLGIISMSTDPDARDYYGPYLPGVGPICPETNRVLHYNNLDDLKYFLDKYGPRVAGFLVEPIQGEAGVVVPDDDYLTKAYELCKAHNVLFIADEVQTGVARTGKMLCIEHSNVKPDVVILGKAISGGAYPVSCVLSSREIMLNFEPGTHGSTYGGNPLGCAVSIAALQVVKEEGLVERAAVLGEKFRAALRAIDVPYLQLVRGKGLLNAVVIDEAQTNGRSAWDLCLIMRSRGILAKPTHGNIIRLTPPLVISEEDLMKGVEVIKQALIDLPTIDMTPFQESAAH
ncbi:ornithine aminotransferase [Schizosaccharomyces japonicus yFS275]|uniref:Ornithine aminotransferase n=1 Tax=Schizosaccharomyces japonicus (strain yFS275 / FY16936) TaxID=402676 RepID=B6JVS7_SCHJY|nr:ornithine aminotransferase [Schizosaccharomyces japonicus yFS275]EEB05478.1 ornithine aminotransferase [Schizosaccharomyces japonicus yFS275]